MGDVEVDADLRQVLDPDSDGRHEVRVQPGVVAEHLPPQVDRLEDEGEGADDGEGQQGVDGRVPWRPVHQAFLRQADVNVEQPIAEQVGHVEAEDDEEEKDSAGGAVLWGAARAARVCVCREVRLCGKPRIDRWIIWYLATKFISKG